ncbi:MAG: hypothetical protein MJK18_08770, partial [Bdellovibrionales bacterium]|nr:hypothetical protein [Bdellovibrionales bacterium]
NSLDHVPHGLVVLSHWDLPWLEDNFIVLRKHRDNEWSLWFKSKRENSIQPQELNGLLVDALKKKFSQDEFELKETLSHEGLALQLFPIYEEKPDIQIKKSLNFYSMGFDHYFSFDLFEAYQNQKTFVQQLLRSEL